MHQSGFVWLQSDLSREPPVSPDTPCTGSNPIPAFVPHFSAHSIFSDIPRLVKKALSDKRILGVHDFSFAYPEDERDAVSISFVADTIYGSTVEEVTI